MANLIKIFLSVFQKGKKNKNQPLNTKTENGFMLK